MPHPVPPAFRRSISGRASTAPRSPRRFPESSRPISRFSVKEDVVTIAGERKPPEVAEDTVWQRRERAYGRFSRAIRLPYRVDPDRVEARFADGVLEIELHRPEADKPRRIQIKAA